MSNDAVEQLAELMRLNLFFYAYSEEVIVDYYERDRFSSMERAAKYAYRNRLPKRAEIKDGLPSEALLDLLVQLYNPSAYKLAVRTILRQDDNNEIKGFDLTYFTRDDNGISLWLGQAKLGGKDYCKSGINDDLLKKFKSEYLSKVMREATTQKFNLPQEIFFKNRTISKENQEKLLLLLTTDSEFGKYVPLITHIVEVEGFLQYRLYCPSHMTQGEKRYER